MGGQSEVEEFLEAMQTTAKEFPVLLTRLDKVGQAPELDPADGGLGIEGLHIVAEVGIDIFVVVTFGELAELPHEAFAAGIVFPRRAPAVSPPIAEGLGVGLERRFTDDIDGAALAHGEVVGRVEGLGGDVAEGAGRGREGAVFDADDGVVSLFSDLDEVLEADGLGLFKRESVSAAEGVAIVLDEPEVVFLAELEDDGEFEGVPKSVCHHDGLGFAGGEGGLQQGAIGISREGLSIDEDGNRSALDDGGDGGGKASGDGDDLVPLADTLVIGELMGGEGGEGDQVGGGSRVHEEAVLHAHELCKFLFHRLSLRPEGQPEIEGT